MRIRLICLLMLMPFAVQAQMVDASMLQDYIGLSKVLKSRGIDPVHVNWGPIEQACLGIKSETNQVPYNECRLRMALDAGQYDGDVRGCRAQGLAAYPDALRTAHASTVITNAQGVASPLLVTVPMSVDEINAGREAQFDNCMRARGWNAPDNWEMGRSGE